ncbi:ribosomal protein S5 domain 2-type protein [Dichotomocladium elegans]|nr:ribosomal protein S5 domain 2-type protein [Dichotomocladium elegans]
MMADYLYRNSDALPTTLNQDCSRLYYHGDGELVSLVLTPDVLDELIRDAPHYPTSKTWSVQDQKKALSTAVTESSVSIDRVLIPAPSTTRFMHEDLSLAEYLSDWWAEPDAPQSLPDPIHVKAYARVGLMGNPSDGFYGKTMSLLIANFWAEVTLLPHHTSHINIMSNPVADPRNFSTLESLAAICTEDGYDHGDRLLLACAKVFYSYCKNNNVQIDTRRGFRAMFDTNVPRQVGLAGSSAIVTAFWKAMLKFYGVADAIPIEQQASLVLSVEQDELGIAAGLQDRVIQAYGGLVYMDFDREFVEKHNYGKYQSLDISLVPPLFLAYVAHPEDSGKVHSTVKQRFLKNDPDVIQAMKNFASFTDQARDALERKDHHTFAQLMTANFEQRRKTYGDAVVGATNLRMVELARQHRCVAKFPGSGGAIVGMWDGDDQASRADDLLKLRHALEKEGYVYVDIIPKEQQV